MSTKTSHLRVHRPAAENNIDDQSSVDPIEQFWSVFTSTTGYRVDDKSILRGDGTADAGDVRLIEWADTIQGRLAAGDMVETLEDLDRAESNHAGQTGNNHDDAASSNPDRISDGGAASTDRKMPVGREAAERIAMAGATIAGELQRMRAAIVRTESELAMRASMIADADAAEDLQASIQTMLSDAVMATGTTAAVLSMLDDDTETLRVASTFGLPPVAMTTPPRQLRGSRGDLEAMVNHVVLADGRSGSIDTYCPPKLQGVADMSMGICVVIRSADLPIGTLWLLSHEDNNNNDEARSFDQRDAAAARLAASSVEQAMFRAAKRSDETDDHSRTSVADRDLSHEAVIANGEISQWQHNMMPESSLLAPHWRADGWIQSDQSWVAGWHAWDVLPDGLMAIAILDIPGMTMTDALAATTARTAMEAHLSYRHRPSDMLRRMSDTMWQSGSIEQPISMMYAQIDPETGSGVLSSAGEIRVIVANRYGVRPLAAVMSDAIGVHIDRHYPDVSFQLQPGETLLAYDTNLAKEVSQQDLGQWMTEALREGTKHPLAAIRRRCLESACNGPIGALTLTHTP